MTAAQRRADKAIGSRVHVRAPHVGPDGYEGEWFVIVATEYRGSIDYGLARNASADYPTVWIHESRVSS